MFNALMLASAFALCFAGCVLLALSQRRNWRLVSDDKRGKPPRTAAIGLFLVLLGLPPCILRDGGSFAALLWPLVFAAAATGVAMVLAYRPSWLRFVAATLRKAD